MGLDWLPGYVPKRNVGPGPTPIIRAAIQDYLDGPKHTKRISEFVRALTPETVLQAATDLAAGADFNYP